MVVDSLPSATGLKNRVLSSFSAKIYHQPVKTKQKIKLHQQQLATCERCPDMVPPSVVGGPVVSKVLLVGQAPGVKEPQLQRPFAWTAGKTLFKWFSAIGLEEEAFRQNVYMSAVCRCFPGKYPKGGDRVPSKDEIQCCSQWLNAEIKILQPELIIPVGKLAIIQYMPCDKLIDVIGKLHSLDIFGRKIDFIPLPHPSGASTWHRMEPGKTLLQDALKKIKKHDCWKNICENL